MPREILSGIQLPPDLARIGVGLLNRFDPDLQSAMANFLDELPFSPETAYQLALQVAAKNPNWMDFLALLKAREVKIPTRAELGQKAEIQLKEQSRHGLAYNYPYFPDVPQPHEELVLDPLYILFLGDINSHDGRRIKAAMPEHYHPAYGFPEVWYEQIGTGHFRKKVRRISPDLDLVRRFYPKNERISIFEKLDRIASEVAHSKVPPIDDGVLDILRFLGLKNEKEFIEKTEKQLIERITKKGGKTTRLRQFMRFAKDSDKLRTKKRRTRENYYCHYLASAWLLWTMAENNLATPDEIAEAVEDTQTMLVHDIMEDLEYKLDYETGILRLPGLDQVINLTYDQILILDAITRKDEDDGAIWLDRIKNISDLRNDTPRRNASLKRRAARCKVADRFANLFKMPYSEGSHRNVIRNLEEAELSGGQLLVNSLLTGIAPVTALRRLRNLTQNEQLESTLMSIGFIARMEKRLAQIRFGEAFLDRLRSEPFADSIIKLIDSGLRDGENNPAAKPAYWHNRLLDLAACYNFNPSDVSPIIPAVEVADSYGLQSFARHKQHLSPNKPWEITDLMPLIEESRQFDRTFIIARGVLPGGVDDIYLPKNIPKI